MTKLSNVRGRITYISSHAKQEHLYAVYETTDRSYWTELARCSQQEFKKSGVDGKCIEARELIIALPESLYEQGMPDMLLKSFTDKFKEKYGVECVAALHHNKRMTNFHIHLIFSERQLLAEPVIKTATRNMSRLRALTRWPSCSKKKARMRGIHTKRPIFCPKALPARTAAAPSLPRVS